MCYFVRARTCFGHLEEALAEVRVEMHLVQRQWAVLVDPEHGCVILACRQGVQRCRDLYFWRLRSRPLLRFASRLKAAGALNCLALPMAVLLDSEKISARLQEIY